MATALPTFDEHEPPTLPPRRGARRITAAILSAVIPGSGQLLLGRRVEAGCFFALLAGYVAAVIGFRIQSHYWGWVAAIWFFLLLNVVASTRMLLGRGKSTVEPGRSWQWLFLTIPVILVSTTIWTTLMLQAAGFHAYTWASSSMEPTIDQNDRFLTDSRSYTKRSPQRGDVIAFQGEQVMLVKRVIGLEGDRISGKDGIISVNGVALNEPYVQRVGEPLGGLYDNFGPVMVPKGRMYLLGDNRNHSLDSRSDSFGQPPLSAVRGKVLYIFKSKHDQTGKAIH